MTFETIYDASAFGSRQWLSCGLGLGLIVLPLGLVARSGSRFGPLLRAGLVLLFSIGGLATIVFTIVGNRLAATALRSGTFTTIEGPFADVTVIRDHRNRRWEKRFSVNGQVFTAMGGVTNAFDDRNGDVTAGRMARIVYQPPDSILRVDIAR